MEECRATAQLWCCVWYRWKRTGEIEIVLYYIYWNSIHVDEYLYSIISLYSLVLPHFLPLPLFLIHASRSSITWYIIDYELFFFFPFILYVQCDLGLTI